VHTEVVDEEKETEPVEDEVADKVRVTDAYASSVSDANEIVWARKGFVAVAFATEVVAVTPLPSRPALVLPQHQIVDADAAHTKSEPVVTTCAPLTDATVSGP